MAAENDDNPALRSAIQLLYDEKGTTRRKAALAIKQMALVGLAGKECVPRLLELLDDEVAGRNAAVALRILADQGVFEPDPEERKAIGDWNAPEECPYCGSGSVMEVISSAVAPGEATASPDLDPDRPWVYVTAHCGRCRHSYPVDKLDVVPTCSKCVDAPAGMELRFHYPKMRYLDYNSPRFDKETHFSPAFRSLYWQCKRCLRTWSPVSDHDLAEECPRCGMRTLVPVARGFPSGPILAAAERKEVFVGASIVIIDEPELACAECGYRCRESAKKKGPER